MIKQYIKGSILDAPQKYIAHGVNAQNKMGSGVAKVLYEKYPEVKEQYHSYFDNVVRRFDKRNDEILGIVQNVQVTNKIILNCFTQEYYGRLNIENKMSHKYVSYDAIFRCFTSIKKQGIKEIAIPKIGAGLAGGNWDIISQIIDDATGDDLDVYVYYLE